MVTDRTTQFQYTAQRVKTHTCTFSPPTRLASSQTLHTPLPQHSMLYFAYGSNMLTERLQARVPSAQPQGRATLSGHGLSFHKRSRDGSGKCSLANSTDEASSVHGVLFEVSPDDLSALDEAEHRGYGYDRRKMSVQTTTRTVEAFAYVAQPAYVDRSLLPYDWYRALVVAGAQQHELPSSYWRRLQTVRTVPDPDVERRAKHRSLLRDAGFLHLCSDA